jgi:hypothetical protein
VSETKQTASSHPHAAVFACSASLPTPQSPLLLPTEPIDKTAAVWKKPSVLRAAPSGILPPTPPVHPLSTTALTVEIRAQLDWLDPLFR